MTVLTGFDTFRRPWVGVSELLKPSFLLFSQETLLKQACAAPLSLLKQALKHPGGLFCSLGLLKGGVLYGRSVSALSALFS